MYRVQLLLRFSISMFISSLNYSVITGGEDDQFEEEKELIMKEIEKVSRLES